MLHRKMSHYETDHIANALLIFGAAVVVLAVAANITAELIGPAALPIILFLLGAA